MGWLIMIEKKEMFCILDFFFLLKTSWKEKNCFVIHKYFEPIIFKIFSANYFHHQIGSFINFAKAAAKP